MTPSPFTLYDSRTASVLGGAHRIAGKNNQDAAATAAGPQSFAAVVCDGCSSAPGSEVGAQLAARRVARLLVDAGAPTSATGFWSTLTTTLTAELKTLLDALTLPDAPPPLDLFLFTVVGVWSDPDATIFFALGDGVFGVDGALTRLGPFADNAPPYLGYHAAQQAGSAPLPTLAPVAVLPTSSVERWLIGSDGVGELSDPLALCADRSFTHPDALRRALAVEARAGRLPDDTTAIVGRRRVVTP